MTIAFTIIQKRQKYDRLHMFKTLTKREKKDICNLFSDTYLDKWNDCFCLFDGKDNDNDMRRLENLS